MNFAKTTIPELPDWYAVVSEDILGGTTYEIFDNKYYIGYVRTDRTLVIYDNGRRTDTGEKFDSIEQAMRYLFLKTQRPIK